MEHCVVDGFDCEGESLGGCLAFDAVEEPFDLNRRSQMAWLLNAGGGWGNTGSNVLVKAQWHEGDQAKVGEWTVTLDS